MGQLPFAPERVITASAHSLSLNSSSSFPTLSQLPVCPGNLEVPKHPGTFTGNHKGEGVLSKENECKRWQTAQRFHLSLKQLLVILIIDYKDGYSAPAI